MSDEEPEYEVGQYEWLEARTATQWTIYSAESIVEAKVEKEPGSRRAKAPKLIWVRLPNPLHYKSKWVL